MNTFLRETNDFFSQYMPPVTRRFFYVISVCFLVFLTMTVLGSGGIIGNLADRIFVLRPMEAVGQFHIWQFATYMFAHAGFLHFFLNILVLFFFGRLIEDYLGERRFFWFIMLSGITGGVLHTILCYTFNTPQIGLLGFSGAIYGLMTAAVLLYPRMTVYFFFFPVPMQVLGAIFGFMLVIFLLGDLKNGFRGGDGVSHVAHAGGVLAAFLLLKFPGILRFFSRLELPRFLRRRSRRKARVIGMGHPGRHSDPDDRYNDPHWYLDQ